MRPFTRSPGHRVSRLALAATLVLAIAACGSPAVTNPPAGATNPPAGTTNPPPAATTTGVDPTRGPVAGEPCSFLTSEQAAAILGAAPVSIAERAGRGDCDYWLDAAQTRKANIGVYTGAEAVTLFEGNKMLGESAPVGDLGEEAYMLVLEGLGTIVMARQGDTVVAAQLLSNGEPSEEAIRAIALARTVVEGL